MRSRFGEGRPVWIDRNSIWHARTNFDANLATIEIKAESHLGFCVLRSI